MSNEEIKITNTENGFIANINIPQMLEYKWKYMFAFRHRWRNLIWTEMRYKEWYTKNFPNCWKHYF